MEQKLVVKKLESAVKKQKAELMALSKKHARRKSEWDKNRAIERKNEAEKLNIRNVCALTYKTKSNIFSNSSKTCEFNPETMHAHSYRWYDLFKVIKGVNVLNTYNYSQQTSRHISKLRTVLEAIGIKYVELQAPKGLQDLNRALEYEINRQAEYIISSKYGRDKKKVPYKIKDTKTLKLLTKLGVKASESMKQKALQDAEQYRDSRLERQRKESALKRSMSKVKIIMDVENKLHGEVGYHVVGYILAGWSDTNEIRFNKDRELRQAVIKGFDTVYVHTEQPRHLSVVAE